MGREDSAAGQVLTLNVTPLYDKELTGGSVVLGALVGELHILLFGNHDYQCQPIFAAA